MKLSPYIMPGIAMENSYWKSTDATKGEKMITVSGIVSNYFRCPMKDILSKGKTGEKVLCRAFAIYFIKRIIPLISLNDIGQVFGNRDHTTIRHANLSIRHWFWSDDGTLKKHHTALCQKLQIASERDWELAVQEGKRTTVSFNSRRRTTKVIKSERIKKRSYSPKNRPSGLVYKKQPFKLEPVYAEIKAEPTVRPKPDHTNKNHEKELETKYQSCAP